MRDELPGIVTSSFSQLVVVWGVAAAVLTIHTGLLAYSATRHSPTENEPGHLVAGLSHWEFGRFELYSVNPPLVRLVAAMPVVASGYKADWSGFSEGPGARPVFGMGADFIQTNGERSIWLFTIARWACIPFSLAGAAFCFLWSRELWGNDVAGLISLTLWCFDPNILAHGELITPDCAAASLGLGASYGFWRWLRQPTWGRAAFAGLFLGLAQLSKMTWVILFGLWPVLWFCWLANGQRNDSRKGQTNPGHSSNRSQGPKFKRFAQLVTILTGGLYLLNFGYVFDETFTPLGEFDFVSASLTGAEDSGGSGNRFRDSWLGGLPVPVPKQYLLGMDVQKRDLEGGGRRSYLRGEWSDHGWWYYYIYGLAVKTPHGTQSLLMLALLSLVVMSRRRGIEGVSPGKTVQVAPRDLVMLLAPAAAVLVLVSSQTGFNQHVRYVLPVFGFLFVFIGVTGTWFRSSMTACLEEREEASG